MTVPSAPAICFHDIVEAADRISEHMIRTPTIVAPQINEAIGAELFFKCENLQHVGAFKARGACNAVFSLTETEAAAGVVTHSSGNHAAALARAAQLRGIAAHIVMPHNSARVKIESVRRYGVEPVFCEPTAESRQATAAQIARETGATFVHPFDDARVMAAQGTVALELFDQVADLNAIVAPVGGGGLLSGILVAAAALNPEVSVYAAEPEWADDAFRSMQSGKIEPPARYDSIADGLRTPLGQLTFPIIQQHVKSILLASEASIRRATQITIQRAHLVTEPSGAVPLASIMQNRERFRGLRVGVVISGGNIDAQMLCQIVNDPSKPSVASD